MPRLDDKESRFEKGMTKYTQDSENLASSANSLGVTFRTFWQSQDLTILVNFLIPK